MRSMEDVSITIFRIFSGMVIFSLILVGFIIVTQVIIDKQLMARSLTPCCNNGDCENEELFNCSMQSTANVKPNCGTSVYVTCRQCVNLTLSGQICYGDGSHHCHEEDGCIYEGTPCIK